MGAWGLPRERVRRKHRPWAMNTCSKDIYVLEYFKDLRYKRGFGVLGGSLRSWIHYVNLRAGNGTQKEHMDIAIEIKKHLAQHFPLIAQACEWN